MPRQVSQHLTGDLAQSLNVTFRPTDKAVSVMVNEILTAKDWTAGYLASVIGFNTTVITDLRDDCAARISDSTRRVVWFLWVLYCKPDIPMEPIIIASWGRSEPATKAEALAGWLEKVPMCLRFNSPALLMDWNKRNDHLSCSSGIGLSTIQSYRVAIQKFINETPWHWRKLAKLLQIKEANFEPFFEGMKARQAETHRLALERRRATSGAGHTRAPNGSVTRKQRLAQQRAYAKLYKARKRAEKNCNTGDTISVDSPVTPCEAAPATNGITKTEPQLP